MCLTHTHRRGSLRCEISLLLIRCCWCDWIFTLIWSYSSLKSLSNSVVWLSSRTRSQQAQHSALTLPHRKIDVFCNFSASARVHMTVNRYKNKTGKKTARENYSRRTRMTNDKMRCVRERWLNKENTETSSFQNIQPHLSVHLLAFFLFIF